jgi:hexokinase
MVPGYNRAQGLLKDLEIHPEGFHTSDYVELFLDEMDRGLRGERSSLKMIPTFVSTDTQIPYDAPAIVIDAGGTNLRTALVRFRHNQEPEISHFSKRGMPGVSHEVSYDEFFSCFADAVEPIFELSDHIGFCFSYAAAIDENRDGRLIVFSKEIKAPDVIGAYIGKGLLDAMAGRGYDVAPKRLTLLNDTVATLLAGKAKGEQMPYSGYVGFILGTGTNTSYVELSDQIHGLSSGWTEKHQIINTESGSFNVPASDFDMDFYRTTKHEEDYHFEKLISGAYLGEYGKFLLAEAARQKLFSPSCVQALADIREAITTVVMDGFLHNPWDKNNSITAACSDADDAQCAYHLLDGIIQRAAKLTAVNLSATILKTDGGVDPRRPVCVNADGTTYYKTHRLQEYTQRYLHEFLECKRGRYYRFVHIENSPVLGAAAAGLIG